MMLNKQRLTLAELKANPPKFSPTQRARLISADADARADKDEINPTWTEDQLKRAVFARTLRELRQRLGMTQVDFAAHYKISASRLKDWERARSRPDTVAEAYISVIRHNHEAVDATPINEETILG